MRMREPLRVFFPTRFHIFDHLATPTFLPDIQSGRIEIYCVYPKRFFKGGSYSSLAPVIRTLWLGLVIKVLLLAAAKLGLQGRGLRWLREMYIRACAIEFRFRLRRKPRGMVLATAGYLGSGVALLQKAGHQVVINHGSLYEPYVRNRMHKLFGPASDAAANWANSRLVGRMDLEFEQANGVIVCSPKARNSFPRTLRKKVSVVPLGAPPCCEGERTTMDSGRITFLHVSNLSLGKNLAGILDAFAEMRGEKDCLMIGGPAPRDPALYSRLTDADPGVLWLGKLDRGGVDAAMRAADIFVHPSFADGWGMAVTEALAAGLPVVASHDTGAASYYADASVEGATSVLLANPADPHSIATAMIRLCEARRTDPHFTVVKPITWAMSAEILSYHLAYYRNGAS